MVDQRNEEIAASIPEPAVLDELEQMIRQSSRMAAFTGAGISTESGIPDYRGPNGVWQTGKIPHINTVRTDSEARREFWQMRRQTYPTMLARQPNAGHRALARFERAGKLLAIVTQNIDGLHQKAGNQPDRVIELHGSSHRIRCLSCGRVYDGEDIQARLDAGEVDPRCEVCGGVLRSATILFGESLPREALNTAHAVARATDLMLVVGSSLVVNPAARLPAIAKDQGAGLIIINRTPTPLDAQADIRVAAEAGPTLEALADRVLGESQV